MLSGFDHERKLWDIRPRGLAESLSQDACKLLRSECSVWKGLPWHKGTVYDVFKLNETLLKFDRVKTGGAYPRILKAGSPARPTSRFC
jgi:hypothetical protein